MNKKLLIIFIIAAGIRLIALNQSFWLDEATTARVVERFGLLDILKLYSPTDFHPPFYYLFMKIWSMVFGVSELAMRAPSVIFSLGTGYILYLIGGKKYGFWAAVFFLFNPLIVYYSQEARMYLMVTFLLTAVLYLFLQALRDKTYKPDKTDKTNSFKSIFLDLCIAFSLFTFYGSIFFIAGLYLYIYFKKQHKAYSLLLPGTVGALIILSPLLYLQLQNAQVMLKAVSNWSLVLGNVSIKNLLLIPLKFSIGRISWLPKTSYYAISGASVY